MENWQSAISNQKHPIRREKEGQSREFPKELRHHAQKSF